MTIEKLEGTAKTDKQDVSQAKESHDKKLKTAKIVRNPFAGMLAATYPITSHLERPTQNLA